MNMGSRHVNGVEEWRTETTEVTALERKRLGQRSTEPCSASRKSYFAMHQERALSFTWTSSTTDEGIELRRQSIRVVASHFKELYTTYEMQCVSRQVHTHPAIRVALLDTLVAAEKDGNLKKARSIDLSCARPPIRDQDLRLLCIALVVSLGAMKELNFIKLSDNQISSLEAARAIILFMHLGNGCLELDLSRNTTISSIDKAIASLRKKLDSPGTKTKDGLYSLVLDGCRIQSLSREALVGLRGIQKISLSYTAISNLWSTSNAFEGLGLKQLQFQEPTKDCNVISCELNDTIQKSPLACRLRLDSPICRERAYRAFLIHRLPQLEVLDNERITEAERKQARAEVAKHYDCVRPENILSLLKKRELGSLSIGRRRRPRTLPLLNQPRAFERLAQQNLHCNLGQPTINIPCALNLRPRQFEYNQHLQKYMVFGSIGGDIHVLDHERQKIVGRSDMATEHSNGVDAVLGLCWMNKNPLHFLAGSDNGAIQLFDVNLMEEKRESRKQIFQRFEELTSLHINSEDQYFVASGYSNHVALYDLHTGKHLDTMRDCHTDHINVLKFSHQSPNMFATASFDRDVKLWDLREPVHNGIKRPVYSRRSQNPNVMVCFSPDDKYLLASALDNEVRQYQTYGGGLIRSFDIRPIHSPFNYSRSYFMNGGDYVITGSCGENTVRIFNATTGNILREIEVESSWFDHEVEGQPADNCPIFVQSLRGDPFNMYNFAVLAAFNNSSSSAIVKVDLLRSASDYDDH